MGDPRDPFEKQLNSLPLKFKQDLLGDVDRQRWPDRIDYIASEIASGRSFPIGLGTGFDTEYIGHSRKLDEAASDHYLDGIVALTDDHRRRSAVSDDFRLGDLLVQFSSLRQGLTRTETEIPPGEVLGRLITRNLKRNSSSEQNQAAQELHTESATPRELISEITAVPELVEKVEAALPSESGGRTLAEQLAEVDLTTQLWDHQLDALAEWLRNDMHGYVDMATATGKTVLGLAAVAHMVDAGSLHPSDQKKLENYFDENLPEPNRDRPDDVLIVTTDDLLGVQWARSFREHCHTPPEYTRVKDGSIRLPWGTIDIRSASAVSGLDPSDYRLAIFDEVHNYSSGTGWGEILIDFIDSPCPVLALTGSVTESFELRVDQADRSFPRLGEPYTHKKALEDGIIPDFSWTLTFTQVQEDENLKELREGARTIPHIVEYETDYLEVAKTTLDSEEPELDPQFRQEIVGQYDTGTELANQLRDISDGPEAPTELLEKVASGLSNRSIHRLNLSTETTIALKLAREALDEGRPVLILTRSYDEAKALWQELYDRNSERQVIKLERGQSPVEQDERIQNFDQAETRKKVLIAPGKRIGQGSDIQSVEVGINIARPGSGANTTLVQRLGRLLRKAGGKDSVEFYHVLGVQPSDTVLPPDGESFVTNVAGFFGEVVAPDTDGMLKPPSVKIQSDEVAQSIAKLERTGAPRVLASEQSIRIEEIYVDAIRSIAQTEAPAVQSDWFNEAFDLKVTDHHNESDDDNNDTQESSVADRQVKRTDSETNNDDIRTNDNTEDDKMNDEQRTQTTTSSAVVDPENREGRAVTVDSALIAIVDATVENPESDHESRNEVVNTAVRSFLKDVIASEVDSDLFDAKITRDIEFSADPTLQRLLEERSANESFPDSIDHLVREALYSYTGLDTDEKELHVENFAEFQFPINVVVEESQYPCETADEVIQIALLEYFDIY